MSDVKNSPDPVPRPWQPRIGLGTILLLMLIASVTAAAASYFVRYVGAVRGGREFQLLFIIFTLAAPLLLVVIVSLFQAIFGRRR